LSIQPALQPDAFKGGIWWRGIGAQAMRPTLGGTMSFQGMPTDDLVRIATAGAGFRLDAAGRSTEDLIAIAAATSDWGVRLVFAGMEGRPTDDLIRIADAGEGNIEFEG
jgi:hypothetical protein